MDSRSPPTTPNEACKEMMDEVLLLNDEESVVNDQIKPLTTQRKTIRQRKKQLLADLADEIGETVVEYRGYMFGTENKQKTKYDKEKVSEFLLDKHPEYVKRYTETESKPVFCKLRKRRRTV